MWQGAENVQASGSRENGKKQQVKKGCSHSVAHAHAAITVGVLMQVQESWPAHQAGQARQLPQHPFQRNETHAAERAVPQLQVLQPSQGGKHLVHMPRLNQ